MTFDERIPIQRALYPSHAAYREACDEHLVALSEMGPTLQAMGDLYGITREMIRQILAAAGIFGDDRRVVRRQRWLCQLEMAPV